MGKRERQMRRINMLSAQFVRQKLLEPRRYPDGSNLYRVVSSGAARSWVFRYTFKGVEREKGLGSAWDVDPPAARAQGDVERHQMLPRWMGDAPDLSVGKFQGGGGVITALDRRHDGIVHHAGPVRCRAAVRCKGMKIMDNAS